MKIAIYPGTFDPITYGHLDIIKRAIQIFDYLIIAPAKDTNKNPLFELDERVAMIKNEIAQLGSANIIVEPFEGLLVNFAKQKNAQIIIRGLRAISDFEFEFQMFGMNSKLEPAIQTVFLPASENHQFIASKLVKEVAKLGGDITKFVSPYIVDKLYRKIANETQR